MVIVKAWVRESDFDMRRAGFHDLEYGPAAIRGKGLVT